jgi:hypothetical protein
MILDLLGRTVGAGKGAAVTTDPFDDIAAFADPEVPREELLRNLKPARPRSETAIADLTDEEWDAFWTAINR